MRGKPAISCPNFSCIRITPAGAGKTNTVAVTRTVKRDHPRRCGENYVAPCLFCKLKGSPPQVRGKRYTSGGGTQPARITPAGAGKTLFMFAVSSIFRDHPRRCGENLLQAHLNRSMPGSPPQVRGKRVSRHSPQYRFWITPAGAGKTLKRSFRNQPFCSGAVQISFNFSNSLNVSLQSGSAR